MKYLLPFLISCGSTIALISLIVHFFKNVKWQGRNSKRHIHGNNISRMGGLVMVIVFLVAIIINKDLVITSELYGFLVGVIIILVIGLLDDIKEVFWKVQLFFQIAVAIFVFIMGIRIYYVTNPVNGGILNLDSGIGVVVSVALVIFWIVLVINAINWSDGIDGLSGGITIISAITIFSLSFYPEVNQPTIAIICSVLIGVTLGFLLFNFYPSKILAGTVGSMFMGFSLAVLSIFSGTKIATALLVLSVPIIDFLWVIKERIKREKSIFKSDKNHLHYKLMELGWSQKKIAMSYYAVTIIISIVALNTRAIGKSVTMLLVAIIMLTVFFLVDKRIAQLTKKNIEKSSIK